jgi:hypothetical protein
MKRVIVFFGVITLLVLGLIFLYEAQAGGPKVLIPETKWDFGLVPAGSVISHYYLVKNLGTDTLKIESVKPG